MKLAPKIRFAISEERDALLEQLEHEAAVGWTNVSPTPNDENLRQLVNLVFDTLWSEEKVQKP